MIGKSDLSNLIHEQVSQVVWMHKAELRAHDMEVESEGKRRNIWNAIMWRINFQW